MTVVAAALQSDRIALAADGVTVSSAGRVEMRDNVKIVPLFGRFAVAWAGEEGLLGDPCLRQRTGSEPLRESLAPARSWEQDPVRRAGRVRIEEIVRACETARGAPPATCREAVDAVYAVFGPRYAETVARTPGDPNGRFVKFFVAGWNENDSLGHVLSATCTVVRQGPDRYRARCAVRQLWSSDQPPVDVDLLPARAPARGPRGHLAARHRAIRLVQAACDDYERRMLPGQFGGVIRCVEVTPTGAHALPPGAS